MVYNGKYNENGWLGGTPILGNLIMNAYYIASHSANACAISMEPLEFENGSSPTLLLQDFVAICINMGGSWNRGTPKPSISMGFSHYKPSILGTPHSRKAPSVHWNMDDMGWSTAPIQKRCWDCWDDCWARYWLMWVDFSVVEDVHYFPTSRRDLRGRS